MDGIIGLISEIVVSLVKHGWSASTLVIFIFALLKFAPFRRFVMRNLPRKLRKLDNRMDSMDMRMNRMESKVDLLLAERGITWVADSNNGKSAPSVTTGVQTKSSSPQAASVLVTIARYFTRLKATYLSQQRRMNMKSRLLSRKFLMALATGILVVLNDGLDLGLDSNTILYVVGIIATWIVGEAAVDVSRKQPEVPNASYTSPTDAGDV